MGGAEIRVRRVYDDAGQDDGYRVLVDRVWPRGLRKDAAHLDDWAKDVAPSTELRRWFHHDLDRFTEFRARYEDELTTPERRAALERLRAHSGTVTLLTATRDLAHSHVTVLAEVLRQRP